MPLFRGILFILSLISLKAIAFETSSLRSGDILLQPLNCFVCGLIEAQTMSPYSHMGIVIKKNNRIYVLEAWQKVNLTPLSTFLKKTEKNQNVKVMRHKFLDEDDYQGLLNFAQSVLGNPYDNDFLFENYIDGKKAYYCSELVYEALSPLTDFLPLPLPMSYDVYPDYWDRYFNGRTPRGERGINPASFDDEKYFKTLGEL